MPISVLDYKETYRLITDNAGHFAVVEARCGHVYSLHGHRRREAVDCEDGMSCVVGGDGWRNEQAARVNFNQAVQGEKYYSQLIW